MISRKKWLLLFTAVLIIFIGSARYAFSQQVLQGQVRWTLESAREEAFEDAPPDVDLREISPTDPNFVENQNALRRGIDQLAERSLTAYSDGFYSVGILDPKTKIKNVFYYSQDGNLDRFTTYVAGTEFSKEYQYSFPDGYLSGVVLYVGPQESYIFDAEHKLKGHWIGNDCFDESGNITLRRFSVK